ncbi:iron-sulfur assembly protein IscA, chloroplastic [Neltuma alba]|uniref:iron-sulfur assembly protein IscA, chloroplastic n=1 Tax=Neltuma alba TaxID=207710 RepID=UPI0010A4DD35|nr:iron-sulfur assembly protein IscA, chloroplastic-like [Prosopis alba]
MAFSAISSYSPQVLGVPKDLAPISVPPNSVSFRFSRPNLHHRKSFSIRSVQVPAAPTPEGLAPAISLTDNALKHLNKMRSERSQDLCLRIGVKQGGCSGMSYTMDFEDGANTRADDSIIEYNGFVIVCDPKSLLFLYGMQLDYSDALIGGGFSFKNPNATQTCGCGKSFAAEM